MECFNCKKRCYNLNKNVEQVLQWTKDITDWHEKAFFSASLPMHMDYHNNHVGRNLFKNNLTLEQDDFVATLEKNGADIRKNLFRIGY